MRCKEEEALKGEGGEGQKERYQFCILKTKLRAAIPLHLTRPLPTHRYNGVGNRVFTRYGGSGMAGDVYDYDSSDQVIGVKYGADDPHLGYAAASNPTSSAAWTYDAAGNRTLATADSDSTTYSVNAINQYTSYTLNSGTPETLSYNSRGDLAGLNGLSFEYDTFGHLVKSSDGSTVSWYCYDGEGRRIGKKIGSSQQEWRLHAGYDLIEVWDPAASSSVSYIYEAGIDQPLAMVDSATGNVQFLHQDVLGNVVMVSDDDGLVVEHYEYDVWGGWHAVRNSDPHHALMERRFLFTSREWDAESSLCHYRARAYSPDFGRFLQQDPIKFLGGDLNLQRYVTNSPTNYSDPTGLINPFGFVTGVIIGASSAMVASGGNMGAMIVRAAVGGALGAVLPDPSGTLGAVAGGVIGAFLTNGNIAASAIAGGITGPLSAAASATLATGNPALIRVSFAAVGAKESAFTEVIDILMKNGFNGDQREITIECSVSLKK